MKRLVSEYVEAENEFNRISEAVQCAVVRLMALCEFDITEDGEESDPESAAAATTSSGIAQDYDLEARKHLVVAKYETKHEKPELIVKSGFSETRGVMPEPPVLDAKQLYRKIAQKTHPDRLMRYSAETKKLLLSEFHAAKDALRSDDGRKLALILSKVIYHRGDDLQPVVQYGNIINTYLVIMRSATENMYSLPYMKAVHCYLTGDINQARILFAAYLRQNGFR